ncbi:YadA-like family protein [Salmonella enterica]|nr:YadA-like family protein [Salmonella enterica]EIS6329317.1 YadA-like family protein [Salmonella enterica]EIS6549493.1 YadA-like family protein [Salmonella enterica]EIS6614229.1 YadA-like family protein [Salmonella enterica]
MGVNSRAPGETSVATGAGSKATGANSVALGAYSVADKDNDVSIGGKIINKFTGLWDDFTRTLSGVTDGTDRDANKYTDDTVSKANEKVLKEANTYTDDTAKKTLKTANEHTERRAVVAENNAVTRSNAYTDDSSSRTLERANTYTNHRAAQAENNAVARSNAYTDNRFGELRKSLQHTEKRLNAGIAGVTAISSIPYAAGNKFSYGIGAGNYQNGNAIAAGVQFRVSQSANVRLNVSWDSAGNNATGVGIAGGW